MQLDVTLNKVQHTPPIHFLVNETVKHGPVIVDLSNKYVALGQAYASGELIVPEDEQAFFKQYVDQTNLLTSSLLLHLFGGISLNLNVAELTITDPADKSVRVTLEGISSTIELNRSMTRLASNFQLQSFSGQNAQSVFTVNNLEGDSDLAKTEHALWLGKVNVQANDATLNTNSKPVFDIKGIQYSSDSSESKGLMDGSCTISLQNVTGEGINYGAGQIGFSLKNINVVPLEELKALAKEMSQAQPAQSNGLAATLKLQQKAMQSRQLMFRMLGRGVQFAIEPVSLDTPKGQILGKFTLNLPNLLDDSKGNPVERPILTIGALLSNATSSLSLSMPKSIVQDKLQPSLLNDMQAANQSQEVPATPEQLQVAAAERATAQIQNWVGSGFLVENGDNYQFSATYDKGQLLANGKPVFSPVSQALAGAAGNNGSIVVTAPGAPMPAAAAPATTVVPTDSAMPATATVPATPANSAVPVDATAVTPAAPATATVSATPADTTVAPAASTTTTTTTTSVAVPAVTVPATEAAPAATTSTQL
jgi:uncharacterized protein YdgA (DUF945 family)